MGEIFDLENAQVVTHFRTTFGEEFKDLFWLVDGKREWEGEGDLE